MGKYMKKSKITGDVGVMEVSQPTSLGVRTRAAKTLALQRLNSSRGLTSPLNRDAASSSYLELRSRRLEKPPVVSEARKPPQPKKAQNAEEESRGSFSRGKVGSRLRVGSVESGSTGSVSVSRRRAGKECFSSDDEYLSGDGSLENQGLYEGEDGNNVGLEPSFGENNLDFEARDRSTRESTPCNLIRESDTILTPGSTTRPVTMATSYRRPRNDSPRLVPTAQELEEFFAGAEKQQQRLFVEKYNFDIVNDRPLPGRFEWVRVAP